LEEWSMFFEAKKANLGDKLIRISFGGFIERCSAFAIDLKVTYSNLFIGIMWEVNIDKNI